MKTLECQKHLFDLPTEVAYLNMAYQSPLLISSVDAGIQGLERKSRPYQIGAADFFKPLREVQSLFAMLIGCKDPNRIAYQPSVSYGMATVVRNLPSRRGGNIVLLDQQFPSNVYPYDEYARTNDLKIRFVDPPNFEQVDRVLQWNERIIDAIDQNTICVSMPQCHWSDGTLFDLVEIRKQCDRFDAWLIVDATQSVGALPFSIEEIRPDAVVCAAYKFLLGPYSSALSYYGPRFDGGQPIEHSWMAREGSEDFSALSEYTPHLRMGAARYSVGESANFIALPMLKDSLRQILAWSPGCIQDYCSELVSYLAVNLDEKYHLAAADSRAAHLFGIHPPAQDVRQLVRELAEEKVFVSARGQAIRVAPYVYNSRTDIDRLVYALNRRMS